MIFVAENRKFLQKDESLLNRKNLISNRKKYPFFVINHLLQKKLNLIQKHISSSFQLNGNKLR